MCVRLRLRKEKEKRERLKTDFIIRRDSVREEKRERERQERICNANHDKN